MSVRYAPLANPRSAPDAEREMQDAFDLDDEHDDQEGHGAHESTPLTNVRSSQPESSSNTETTAIPGTYDFEREYDFPPPGSPPSPSARALPNDYGNTNGFLPTSPVDKPKPKRSFFSRVMGAVLPSRYHRVPTEHITHPTGGGIENDGVFANVTAKPQPARVIQGEDGDIHVVPEDTQKETPPSYLEAQADAVPPYWETTIHAPATVDPNADLIIDDLPTGSFLIFCLNTFISFFFQFVGFLLTYLLHTSHAAKFGSRAGLGLTLIQYGFYSRTMSLADDTQGDGSSGQGSDANWPGFPSPTGSSDGSTLPEPPQPSSGQNPGQGEMMMSTTSRDWLSFLFMTLGWFLLLSSVIGYWRVKRWEQSVRPPPPPPTAEELQRDRDVRRRLEEAFGIPFGDPPSPTVQSQAEDARLTRDLRAAGLL
ncbi:unnamed protein product [Cyclocybe aegerita]|uniref:Metal homeostatis protein bsd2 n=1 Tax=Cyclocybe aegerita TaxID=1973307 RepID=A0A8S0WVZ0_CYCAE|nr:unnamed protein product [Cyclocybe aegerita]